MIRRSAPCRGVVFTAILLYLLFLRIRCDHRSDGGRVIRVLRNADLHIPQALEILDDLAALEEFGQATDEDIILDAGVPGGQDSGLADVLDDHMDDTSRDVLGLGLGIRFADAGKWDIPLAYDGVHFTEKGHRAFAAGLLEEIR